MNNLQNVEKLWSELNEKMDRNWKLNLEILKTANLDKARRKLRHLIFINSLTLIFYGIFAILFAIFAVRNWDVLHYAITGIVLATWTTLVCAAAIHEVELLTGIDYSKPIPDLQKRLIKMKLTSIKYMRLAVWIFPLNFAFIILFFKFLFGVDIVAIADQSWLIGNLIFSAVFFVPLAIWAHRKLSPENAHKPWINALLRGNGSQITEAAGYLSEIEAFEKNGSLNL